MRGQHPTRPGRKFSRSHLGCLGLHFQAAGDRLLFCLATLPKVPDPKFQRNDYLGVTCLVGQGLAESRVWYPPRTV